MNPKSYALQVPGRTLVASPDGSRWIISRDVIVEVTRKRIPTQAQVWTLRRRVCGAIVTVARDVDSAHATAFLDRAR